MVHVSRGWRYRAAIVLTTVFATSTSAVAGTVTAAPAAAAIRCDVVGTEGDDWLFGTAPEQVICGLGGDDQIWTAPGGTNTVYGGSGDDVIHGHDNPTQTSNGVSILAGSGERLYGEDGNDRIYGMDGPDWIEGGNGDDYIEAGDGQDHVYGDSPSYNGSDPGFGHDVIYDGNESGSVFGGPGDDYLHAGNPVLGGAGSYGEHEERTAAQNMMYGGDGDDVLVGGGEDTTMIDQFDGDAGNDILLPNPFRLTPLGNSADGGAGNDVIFTLNGLADFYDTDPAYDMPLTKACTLSIEPDPDGPDAVEKWGWKCTLPWLRLPIGLNRVFDLTYEQDSTGAVGVGGDLTGGLGSFKTEDWAELRTLNVADGLAGDVTFVDYCPVRQGVGVATCDWTW